MDPWGQTACAPLWVLAAEGKRTLGRQCPFPHSSPCSAQRSQASQTHACQRPRRNPTFRTVRLPLSTSTSTTQPGCSVGKQTKGQPCGQGHIEATSSDLQSSTDAPPFSHIFTPGRPRALEAPLEAPMQAEGSQGFGRRAHPRCQPGSWLCNPVTPSLCLIGGRVPLGQREM